MTDTISVLDQSIRVLQAYIDITAEQGCLSTTLMLIKTMVSVKQAIWDDTDPMAILPGVNKPLKMNVNTKLTELPNLKTTSLDKLASSLGIDKAKIERFRKVARSLPSLTVNVLQSAADVIRIELGRVGHSYGPDYRAYTPLFPKAQNEGWFVIMCDPANDEILAMKRASFSQHSKTTTKLGVPEECHGMHVELRIISDVYPDTQFSRSWQLRSDSQGSISESNIAIPEVLSLDIGAAKAEIYEPGQQLE